MSKLVVFPGQQIIPTELDYMQEKRTDQVKNFLTDIFTDGIVLGHESGTFFITTVTGATISIAHGMGVKSGDIIKIDNDKNYSSTPNLTVDGLCVPQSSGNVGVPLVNYGVGVNNYVFIKYKEVADLAWWAIDKNEGVKRYTWMVPGYEVLVDTVSGVDGITNDYLQLGRLVGNGTTISNIFLNGLTVFSEKLV